MDIKVVLHPHALSRLDERGISEKDVISTVLEGERFVAKFGRTGFRRNFSYERSWHGRYYTNQQVEVFAVLEENVWVVITIISRYF